MLGRYQTDEIISASDMAIAQFLILREYAPNHRPRRSPDLRALRIPKRDPNKIMNNGPIINTKYVHFISIPAPRTALKAIEAALALKPSDLMKRKKPRATTEVRAKSRRKWRDRENRGGYTETRKAASKPAFASCDALPIP